MISIWIHSNIAKLGSGDSEFGYSLITEETTIGDILRNSLRQDDGILFGIIDETGSVRSHINIFVGSENIRHRDGLDTVISDGAEISIFPAVSGG